MQSTFQITINFSTQKYISTEIALVGSKMRWKYICIYIYLAPNAFTERKKEELWSQKGLLCGIKGAIERRAFWFILYLHFPFTAHIFLVFFSFSFIHSTKMIHHLIKGATSDARTTWSIHLHAHFYLFFLFFCTIKFTVSCFNHVHLQFQTHDIIFNLILVHILFCFLEWRLSPFVKMLSMSLFAIFFSQQWENELAVLEYELGMYDTDFLEEDHVGD